MFNPYIEKEKKRIFTLTLKCCMNSSTKSRTVVATSLARLASNNGFLSRSPTPTPPPSVVEKSLALAKNTNCSIGSQI